MKALKILLVIAMVGSAILVPAWFLIPPTNPVVGTGFAIAFVGLFNIFRKLRGINIHASK